MIRFMNSKNNSRSFKVVGKALTENEMMEVFGGEETLQTETTQTLLITDGQSKPTFGTWHPNGTVTIIIGHSGSSSSSSSGSDALL